jgi:hypothetical protein
MQLCPGPLLGFSFSRGLRILPKVQGSTYTSLEADLNGEHQDNELLISLNDVDSGL